MFLLFLVIFLVITLLSLLYLRWRSMTQYWAVRGVPHEKPHPFLGSLISLQHESMGVFFRKMYEKFNSKSHTPYFGIWYFWKPALVINCPNIAHNILVKDFGNFRNRLVNSSASDPIGGLNIFTVNDPLWSKIRQRLSPVFTAAKLKQIHPYIQQKSKELIQRIETEKNNRFSLRDTLADFTTDIIGASAFGVSSNATLTGEDPLRTITKELMKYSVYRGIAMSSIFFWPELVDFFRFTFFPKLATDYFKKIFKVIVSQQDTNEKNKIHNFMDALLQIKNKAAQDGEDYPDDLLIAQSLIFLQGGFDTTAVTLTFMILEMAFEPQTQEKLYIELLEAKEKNNSESLNPEVLERLTYLNCVVKETLRKYPAMPWLDRIAANDYVIDENLKIKAGTPIAVNNIGIHFDPEYYPEPYKFNPDRFLPENENNMRPYTYLPFGDGPRSCIGVRFGLMTIRTTMSSLVLKYRFDPYPDTRCPNKTEIEKKGLFYMPGETINIKFTPRS